MVASSLEISVALDRREVLILANPKAGSRTLRKPLEDLVSQLRFRGLQPSLCWEREALPDHVKKANGSLRCVVAAGGDGTFQEVLNRVPGLPISVFPLGNENLLARHFHFLQSGQALAETIARDQIRKLDLGRVNGRYFSLMASAGFDADVVRHVHSQRAGHVNKLSYVWPLCTALQHYSFPAIRIDIEETGECLQGALAFVFNLPMYGLGIPIAKDARPDDGYLDLWVFKKPGVVALARYLDLILRGRQDHHPDIQHRLVKQIHLSSDRPVPLQMDGDAAGQLPATLEVVPGAMDLVVPKGDR
jgi:YegS/Rv2252/BmrU family lipid kinase